MTNILIGTLLMKCGMQCLEVLSWTISWDYQRLFIELNFTKKGKCSNGKYSSVQYIQSSSYLETKHQT